MKAKTIRNLKVFGVEMVEELVIGVLYYLTWFRLWIGNGSDFPVWGKVVVGLLAVVATSILIDAILLIFTRLRSTISSSYSSRKYREDEEEYRKNHPNEFDYAGNRIYPNNDDEDDYEDEDDDYEDEDDEDDPEDDADEEKAEYDAAYEAGRKAAARVAAYQAGYSDYMSSLNKEKVEETEEATNETSEEEKPENSEEADA